MTYSLLGSSWQTGQGVFHISTASAPLLFHMPHGYVWSPWGTGVSSSGMGNPCRRLSGTVDLRQGGASWRCSCCHMQVTQPPQCSTACYLLATKQFCSNELSPTYVLPLSTTGGTLSSVLTSCHHSSFLQPFLRGAHCLCWLKSLSGLCSFLQHRPQTFPFMSPVI